MFFVDWITVQRYNIEYSHITFLFIYILQILLNHFLLVFLFFYSCRLWCIDGDIDSPDIFIIFITYTLIADHCNH